MKLLIRIARLRLSAQHLCLNWNIIVDEMREARSADGDGAGHELAPARASMRLACTDLTRFPSTSALLPRRIAVAGQ
jgi:hypothetical protein